MNAPQTLQINWVIVLVWYEINNKIQAISLEHELKSIVYKKHDILSVTRNIEFAYQE